MYCSNCGLYPNAKWRFVNAKQAGSKRVNKLSRIALFCITAPRDTNISCCALHLITASLQSYDSLFQSQVVGNRGKLKRRAKEKTEIAFLQPVRVRIFSVCPDSRPSIGHPHCHPAVNKSRRLGVTLTCCVALQTVYSALLTPCSGLPPCPVL